MPKGSELMSDVKDIIKGLCLRENITLKDLALKAGMNEKGLHNKFKRDSITLKDFKALLSALGYQITIDKKSRG